MSKKVDWTGKYDGASEGPLKKRFKELAQQEESVKKSNAELWAMKPQLKAVLNWYCTNRKPLQVLRPIHFQTEKFIKSQVGGSFTTVQDILKPGTILTFKSLEKSTAQLLFSDQNGEDVAIYTSDMLVGGRHGLDPVQNTGITGLLYNTSVFETLNKLKEDN